LGQQDFARETIADAPEDFMAHIGLEAIERQDDPALGVGEALEAIGVLQREAEQFIIAIQELSDRPLGYGDTSIAQRLMDFRDAAVLAIASVAHPGDDIEAELVLGEGQAAFGFRAIGFTKLQAGGVEAAANLQRETQNGLQGREGAVVVVSGPHGIAAAWAVTGHRQQGLRGGGHGTGGSTSHRHHLQGSGIPMVSV
jgi:hypothetical protein